jgi:hypothetical protein
VGAVPGRRARTAPAAHPEVIAPLGRRRLPLAQRPRRRVDVPRQPVRERSHRRVRVLDDQRQRPRARRRIAPRQRGRDVLALARIPARDLAACVNASLRSRNSPTRTSVDHASVRSGAMLILDAHRAAPRPRWTDVQAFRARGRRAVARPGGSEGARRAGSSAAISPTSRCRCCWRAALGGAMPRAGTPSRGSSARGGRCWPAVPTDADGPFWPALTR